MVRFRTCQLVMGRWHRCMRRRGDHIMFKFISHTESVPGLLHRRFQLPFYRAVDVEGTRQIKYFYRVVDRYEQLVEEPELVLVQRREGVSLCVEGQEATDGVRDPTPRELGRQHRYAHI